MQERDLESIPGVIFTARLALVPLEAQVLAAFAAKNREQAAGELGISIPETYDLSPELAAMRLRQIQQDPGLIEWLLRGVVVRHEPRMIGHIGFHSRPDPDYLHPYVRRAVEIGYTIYPPYRRQGYAREAAQSLMHWAQAKHGVRRFVASVGPGNEPSLRLIEGMGFIRIGTYQDPQEGEEGVYLWEVE